MLTFRKKVAHWAHEIYNTCECTQSESWQRAWEIYRLQEDMKQGPVEFAYLKVEDGSTRSATGHLTGEAISRVKGTGNFTRKSVPYFDTDKDGFRSFRPANFIGRVAA